MNRREFLLLASAAALAGCNSVQTRNDDKARSPDRVVDAGPANNYAAERVYGEYRDLGFFVVRKGERVFALSSTCTHKDCRLAAEPDRSFYCKCHGSTFDPDGKVTRGPAKRDLPVYPVSTNGKGHLLVTMSGG